MTQLGSLDLDTGSHGKPMNSWCVSLETECIKRVQEHMVAPLLKSMGAHDAQYARLLVLFNDFSDGEIYSGVELTS